MKIIKVAIVVVVLAGLGFIATTLLGHKFKSGWCVKDNGDGYIWQINDFQSGKYQIMGWQDNAWGNPTEVEKVILERKDEGVQQYNRTTCPEFIPK